MTTKEPEKTKSGQYSTGSEDNDRPALAEVPTGPMSFKPVLWWIVAAGYFVGVFGVLYEIGHQYSSYGFPMLSLVSVLGMLAVGGVWTSFRDGFLKESILYGVLAISFLSPSFIMFGLSVLEG